MEQFATEEQQVEAIKRFWKENGMAIVIGAVLGLGGLWGWRYYSDSQIAAKEQASVAYQNVVQNLQAENGNAEAEAFLNEYNDSGYAAITALVMAAKAVQDNDLAKANEYLQTATNAQDAAVRDVAHLRLARVLLAQDDAQGALQQAGEVKNAAFNAQVEELKGDAYVQMQDFVQARLAYSNAVDAAPENRMVKMKLDNLAIASES
ncbi:YfgM family protein [Alteromonas flava]|uniref:YfgM family protein n=1 Tax=Alteromonas flava TaxID=2048003 RepID=UPI000C290F5A|nr:tetratricopeptide repeat protein [Alteromonas flava]